MPWPEQEIEERLYELPDVLAARVSDEAGSLHVGVLVRPSTDRDSLSDAILDRIQLAAGAVPEVIDLRVMPLGATAETRLVRPAAGVGIAGAPTDEPAEPAPVPLEAEAEAEAPAPAPMPEAGPAAVPPSAVPAPSGAPVATLVARAALKRVTSTQQGTDFSAEVEVAAGERSVVMRAEGLATEATTHRLVAEATARALDALAARGRRLGVEFAEIMTSPAGDVAVVGVVIADPAGERIVTGSATVRNGNRLDAIARAVLDATNRRR